MRHLLAGGDCDVQVESAGTSGWHIGGDADPRSRAEWERRGVRHDHRAQRFTRADLDRFDLVLAMDRQNLADLRELAAGDPDATARIALLRQFDPSAPEGAEVPDPYYGGERGFVDVYDMVERACRGVLRHLCGAEGRRGT